MPTVIVRIAEIAMTNRYDAGMNRLNAAPVHGGLSKALDDCALAAVERRLGFMLPNDYREVLSMFGHCTGGGEVRFRNMDNPSEVETTVDIFYGIGSGDTYDLLLKKESFGDRLPSYILPVASSPGGHIVLSLAGSDIGSVYWWSPHRGSVDPRDDMELISRSFDSFINSLVISDAPTDE